MLGVTEQEIEDNTVLICSFMGLEGTPKFLYLNYKYHQCFNLLIPVCNKILKLVKEDRELYQRMCLERQNQGVWAYYAWRDMFSISDISGQLDIEAVYLRVCDFLRWHKQLNNNKNINNEN